MKKYKITNLRTSRETFPMLGENEDVLDLISSKERHYGYKARSKRKPECDEFELTRIISEETRQENFGIDDQGVEIFQDVVYVELPDDFIIEDLTVEYNRQSEIQAKIQKGKADRIKCERVLDLVAGYNRDRELSIEQITQMQQSFSQAEAMLRANRPDFAKQLISAITPDEVLITTEMKNICLGLL
jgi:hypothetical protein